MSGASMGRRRRRVYPRKFDWAEARRRHAAGETCSAIAKSYGVNKEAVRKVLRMPEQFVATATPEQVSLLEALRPNQVPCPRCERPMSRNSELCQDCFHETREFAPVQIKSIPGKARAVLADVAPGRIVCVNGRWGVVVRGSKETHRRRRRLVDFWDGGVEYVLDVAVVRVAPGKRYYVNGVEQQPEEIGA